MVSTTGRQAALSTPAHHLGRSLQGSRVQTHMVCMPEGLISTRHAPSHHLPCPWEPEEPSRERAFLQGWAACQAKGRKARLP